MGGYPLGPYERRVCVCVRVCVCARASRWGRSGSGTGRGVAEEGCVEGKHTLGGEGVRKRPHKGQGARRKI